MQFSIKIDTKAIDRTLADMQRQVKFATALALTRVAQAVQRELPAELDRSLDRPTPFTRSGFFIKPARKDNLVATVGIKPTVYGYLRKQIEGGTVQPDKGRLKLPSEVQLNRYGNIPRGLVKKLVMQAKGRRKLTKALSSKTGINRDASLFYGSPGRGWPEGIYRRTPGGLIPVIVFPRKPARYQKRFDFEGATDRIAQRVAQREIEAALAQVMRSAR
ncbi:MAG: hypothetical protein KDG57_20060 [Rhodoferax sp.]|nr:hypothetical protein [Rhodoferax sp.]